MKLNALNNYVTLKMLKPSSMAIGSIFIPPTQEKTPRWGKVLTTGPGVPDITGELQKPDVEVDQTVYVMAHGKYDIEIDNDEFTAVSVLDILAVLEDIETMKIKPLGNYVEIEKLDKSVVEKLERLVKLPSTKKVPTNIGRVKTLGKGWKNPYGKEIPFQVKEGDIVYYNEMGAMLLDFNSIGKNATTVLISASDLIATLENE